MAEDRANDPRRKIRFYDGESGASHTAEVRIVGKNNKKPHAGDVNKNMKNYKGNNSGWDMQD